MTAPRLAGRHGKLARKSDFRTLRMSSYLKSVPTAPEAVDNIGRALGALKATKADIPNLFPMDGNDEYGDCTICGIAHAETLWEAFLGKTMIPPQASVTSTYFKLSGGADTGLAELDVLNWWRKNQFSGSNILAYVAVKPSDHNAVKLAISWFGGVYVGVQCTQEMEQQFDAGVPFTPGKLTNDGHCMFAPSYTADMVTFLTWGGDADGTWAYWDETVDECYALVPFEATKPGFNALWNWSQLNADIRLVTN